MKVLSKFSEAKFRVFKIPAYTYEPEIQAGGTYFWFEVCFKQIRVLFKSRLLRSRRQLFVLFLLEKSKIRRAAEIL